MTDHKVLKGAIIGGLINAIINGAIQLYLLKDHAPVPLSVDGITNDAHTVFGAAVPLAVSLAMILTVIGYLTLKEAKKPFWPDVLWLTVKHDLFAFGLIVFGAVVWQRVMGSVSVSLIMAAAILSVVAGLVAGMINYMTIYASRLSR